ncbi:MAG: 4Fe-4S dicluster domain-containing protein [Verrucomicrobiae bacterium]
MSLVEKVRQAGVVGAGGGGFPAHVKLAGKADTVIANGAECEPLLHKDSAVMQHLAAEVVEGVRLVMQAVGAKEGVVGIKAKKKEAVAAIQAACQGTPVRVHLLGDYYPAGDEYELVHAVTGRLIPPQGIPLQVGVVVSNVETLANITAAANGVPVTRKTITLAGAVKSPMTITVPVGTTFREVIGAAGGLVTDDPVLFVGGLMMGQLTDDLDTPVIKTSTGAVILPRDHHLAGRRLKPAQVQGRIGKSACDQCRFCTELCPRYLLGYAVEPHQVMRSLSFTATGKSYWNQMAANCCACGLCTLYSCPEELYPKEACDASKGEMRAEGIKWTGPAPTDAHAMHDGRKVPIKMLMQRLHVGQYDSPAPLSNIELKPRQLILPLKQSAGVPNNPLVKTGESVRAGQPLGAIPADALGAPIHAPFDGTVADVTGDRIILTRKS